MQRNRFPPSSVAGAILILVFFFTAAGLGFLYLNRSTAAASLPVESFAGYAFALSSAVIGYLIVRQQPVNQIGWWLCVLALPISVFGFASEYAIYGLVVSPSPLPGSTFMAWLQNWVLYLSFPAPMAIPYLLFPDGKLLSPRWRWVIWLSFLATISSVTLSILNSGRLIVNRSGEIELPMMNPTGIIEREPLFEFIGILSWILGVFVIQAAVVSIILRYRRSQGAVRQQIRWLAYLSGVFLIGTVLGFFVSTFLPSGLSDFLGNLTITGLLLSIPLGIGIAILRYQLYDIDLLIKRTVVYSILTGALTGIYFLTILMLQSVIPATSTIAIVLSTLLIAALFTPLRKRIQSFIDRRFYRQKYDSEKVLATFNASIRDEVEVTRISGMLAAVVEENLQPEHTSLWLREVK